MESLRAWLIAMIAVSAILSVMMSLLPEGSVKKIAGVTGGLALIIVLLQGVVGLRSQNFSISFENYAEDINRQIDAYRNQSQAETETLIQERCGAYISEQAQALGLVCSAEVVTEWTVDGIPIPIRVTLDIPFDTALSDIIAQDLGVDEEHQVWQSTERKIQ